jgi:hypothetical protein
MDYDGLGLPDTAIHKLVALTGPRKEPPRLGFTYSDLRTRLVPEALGSAFPDRKLTVEDLLEAALSLQPSPSVENG